MTMVLEDMGRYDEALQALQQAKRLDPGLGFAQNPAGVENKERSVSRKAGGAISGRAPYESDRSTFPPRRDSIGRNGGVQRSERVQRNEKRLGSFSFSQQEMLS